MEVGSIVNTDDHRVDIYIFIYTYLHVTVITLICMYMYIPTQKLSQ